MAKILVLDFGFLKFNLCGYLFLFIAVHNGGNVPLKLMCFIGINFQ